MNQKSTKDLKKYSKEELKKLKGSTDWAKLIAEKQKEDKTIPPRR